MVDGELWLLSHVVGILSTFTVSQTLLLLPVINCIRDVIVSMLNLCVADRGIEPRSGQTKDYKIAICCFSAKHAELRRKSKDWLARNQDNVSEWGDMSIHRVLFQWDSTIKNWTKPVGLAQSGPHHHLIEN